MSGQPLTAGALISASAVHCGGNELKQWARSNDIAAVQVGGGGDEGLSLPFRFCGGQNEEKGSG